MTTIIHPLEQYVGIFSAMIFIAIIIGIILLIYSPHKLRIGLVWISMGLFLILLSIFGYSIGGILIGLFTLAFGMIPISLSTKTMSKSNKLFVIVSLMIISLIELILAVLFSFLAMAFLLASLITLSCGFYAFFNSENERLRSKNSS